jgi:tyrosyl-tRNA synthetase
MKKMTLFEELQRRGLIAQMTHEEEIKEHLANNKVTFYIGFDPTADSLHVGHFLQMIVMSHMQRAGHRVIALLGGGTTMVGDPSGKTDMRKMMTQEQIQANADKFKIQMSKFIDFSDENKAIMVNNAEWLLKANYVDFLREVGVHFSVNRMLSAECFKSRLERGLSFIEFNYMLMQSYDFLVLNDKYNCTMQFGGDDQWSNIIGGVELVRRARGKSVYGMTFTLLTTSEGKKMGKTEKGALWLDPEKTTPFEFYQYWRNVDDADVIRCLKMLTFLPIEEIEAMEAWEGSELNKAKQILAYELTKVVHGEDEADKAQEAALALFGGGGDTENMPTTEIILENGQIGLLDLLVKTALTPSKGEARRVVEQGGLTINNIKITDPLHIVTAGDFVDNELIIKKGKKIYHKVVIV